MRIWPQSTTQRICPWHSLDTTLPLPRAQEGCQGTRGSWAPRRIVSPASWDPSRYQQIQRLPSGGLPLLPKALLFKDTNNFQMKKTFFL